MIVLFLVVFVILPSISNYKQNRFFKFIHSINDVCGSNKIKIKSQFCYKLKTDGVFQNKDFFLLSQYKFNNILK